jgi:ATP-dependent Clp protease protease subunit
MKRYTLHGKDEGSPVNDFGDVITNNNADNRRIFFWGEVDDNLALSVISQMHYFTDQSLDPIQIIINSEGGSVDSMIAIVNEMEICKSNGVTISTLVSGVAYSAAALILAFGSKGHRYARPNSNIMLHPMSYGLGHDYSEYQEKIASFYKKVNDNLHNLLMQALGIKGDKQYKKFLQDIDKGLWLTAHEALERKIVDKICLDFPLRNSKKLKEKCCEKKRSVQ